jgi:hypothetical protein
MGAFWLSQNRPKKLIMSYHPLPLGTHLSTEEFIEEMNKAIRDDDQFREGMVVIVEEAMQEGAGGQA